MNVVQGLLDICPHVHVCNSLYISILHTCFCSTFNLHWTCNLRWEINTAFARWCHFVWWTWGTWNKWASLSMDGSSLSRLVHKPHTAYCGPSSANHVHLHASKLSWRWMAAFSGYITCTIIQPVNIKLFNNILFFIFFQGVESEEGLAPSPGYCRIVLN